jgi:hypothetical protein
MHPGMFSLCFHITNMSMGNVEMVGCTMSFIQAHSPLVSLYYSCHLSIPLQNVGCLHLKHHMCMTCAIDEMPM